MNEALLEAISIAGSQAALAKHLKLRQQAVAKWVLNGRVPPFRAIQIEEMTGGAITRGRLRPDLFDADSIATPVLMEKPADDDQRSLAADGRSSEGAKA
ncbi:helix-turn-helix domain-containing protein [Thiothrix litoralis]|uniref:Helix-turn-helix domain-containing protein n=1 Tax=Thiothrix litoralis TaxID=2891210 RepID=A0ABX7WUI9_9GAMM|nr:Cro/CI family transcriptional regulator [Thiothrix litoralis]QTR47486.1 helix-turn-helix domain-containing protein [Thiothrix litoralis]